LYNQFLFTAGMTLLDSIDSILMLYSYTGFPERGFRIFEPVDASVASEERGSAYQEVSTATQTGGGDSDQPGLLASVDPASRSQSGIPEQNKKKQVEVVVRTVDESTRDMRRNNMTVKRNMMSGLSIVLTLMSIIVAFRRVYRQDDRNITDVPPVYH
jgi:high-affinity nickel-transport protein